MWFFILINAFLAPYLISEFGITTVTLSLGFFTLLNTAFIAIVVKESAGFSKIELETLYDKKISVINSIESIKDQTFEKKS